MSFSKFTKSFYPPVNWFFLRSKNKSASKISEKEKPSKCMFFTITLGLQRGSLNKLNQCISIKMSTFKQSLILKHGRY